MENEFQEKMLPDLQKRLGAWLPESDLLTSEGIRESIGLLEKIVSKEIASDMAGHVDYSLEDPGKNAEEINKLIDDLRGLLPVEQTK